MLITVVIATYNRRDLLARCLKSLFRQTCPSENFEIVIVIDGATDRTREYLDELPFLCAKQILEQENRGQAAARNAGIRAARGKYILLLDDDFLCDERLLDEHIEAHDGSACVVVGPILHDGDNDNIPALAIDREIRPFYESLAAGISPRAWFPPNSSVTRDLLLAWGGYDERFSRAREDTDLGLRLSQRGVTFRFAPAAIVHQHYDKSDSRLVASAALFGRNDVLLARKFPPYAFQSNLSRVCTGSVWKRAARRIIVALPFSTDLLLYPVYALSALFTRELAIRMLNLRRYIVWIRSAAREAGGWRSLVALSRNAEGSSPKQAD
ncbi:MAG: glycosyltransferase family 2 protein [Acidobacteriaceae bacterium]